MRLARHVGLNIQATVQAFFISRPTRLAADLYGLFSSGDIWPHLLITCYETLGGLVIGTVFGVLTGFAAGLSPRFGDAIEPIIVAFNSMPRIAIAPLFVIWLGFGPESKIALAALVVYFVVFFNTVGGIRAIPPALSHSIRTMGGTKYNVLRFVTFPFCLSWVFAATKVSISMALLGAVVGEFVGSQAGLGWLMLQASGTLDTTRLFSCMVILAAFGSLLFLLVKLVEDRMLRWRPH